MRFREKSTERKWTKRTIFGVLRGFGKGLAGRGRVADIWGDFGRIFVFLVIGIDKAV